MGAKTLPHKLATRIEAVMISHVTVSEKAKSLSRTQGLAVGEGLETVLAGIVKGFRPAWALGDASNIENFPVISGIEALTILVDNDVSRRGQRAALECSRRWTRAGREVLRAIPNHAGYDFNDLLIRNAAA